MTVLQGYGAVYNTREWITKREGSVRNSIMIRNDKVLAYIAEKQ